MALDEKGGVVAGNDVPRTTHDAEVVGAVTPPEAEEFPNTKGNESTTDIEAGPQPDATAEPPYTIFGHRQKVAIIILVSFTGVISPFSASVYFPALPSIAQDLDVSISLINLTVTTYLILQGIAPAFIGNFSDSYGRRPAYMVCCAIYLGANIGLALQSSYAALLVLRCLQSCGSSATIALGSATAADLVTRAERGKYMGYASMGVTLGPALGPVIGGLLDQYLGWRSIFWFLTILSGVLFLLVFAFLPETCRNVVGNGSVPAPWYGTSLVGYLAQRRRRKLGEDIDRETVKLARKRPNPLAALKLLGEKEVGIVLGYSSLVYGGYYLLLTTLSTQLADRFGFSAVTVGLCYLPLGLGSLCYRYTAGYLMDWNFRRHAKKRGIIIVKNRQSEMQNLPIERMRLEVSIPLAYLASCLVIAYGWAMETKSSLAGIEIALFFSGLCLSGTVNNLNTFIVDLHVNQAATAVAASNLTRCLMGAGAAAIASPLIDRIGLGWTSVFAAGVWVVFSPLLWLIMFKGEKWRQKDEEKAKRKAGAGRS